MTYEIYRYIFLIGAVLAVIMFIVTVLLFFLLQIPTVIGDLTGANARRAIENIRNQNEHTGEKVSRTSRINRERGRLTDKISPSGNLVKAPSRSLHGAMGTAKIGTQRLGPDVGTPAPDRESTETTVLTSELSRPAEETTVISQTSETTVLTPQSGSDAFVIEYEITYVYSNEVIE